MDDPTTIPPMTADDWAACVEAAKTLSAHTWMMTAYPDGCSLTRSSEVVVDERSATVNYGFAEIRVRPDDAPAILVPLTMFPRLVALVERAGVAPKAAAVFNKAFHPTGGGPACAVCGSPLAVRGANCDSCGFVPPSVPPPVGTDEPHEPAAVRNP